MRAARGIPLRGILTEYGNKYHIPERFQGLQYGWACWPNPEDGADEIFTRHHTDSYLRDRSFKV